MSTSVEQSGAEIPLGDRVELLQRLPCGLLALSKPAGMLSHPNERGEEDRSLIRAEYSMEGEFYEWSTTPGGTRRLWLLNRLDSATSGVLLVAETQELADAIKAQFREKRIRKVYNALVFGLPSVPVQVWHDRLAVEKKAGQVRTSGAGNIPCESQMRLLQRTRGQPLLSLLQLEPRTGRSHQLRVQCALRRLPIVGDLTYGNFAANRSFAKQSGFKRLFLHSLETKFDFSFKGQNYSLHAKAPLPEDFRRALKI